MIDASAQRLDGFARGLAEEFADGGDPVPVLLARIAAADTDGTTVELFSRALLGEPRTIRLATAGRHNVANALGVVAAARALDLPSEPVLAGAASFAGVGRRLERKGEAGGVTVYDDYGHHPTAIRETIGALRQREPGRRLWAVYEPLTFHRTAAMLDDFAAVLADADAVAVADIWAGRDPDTTVASAAGLAEAVAARRPGDPRRSPGIRGGHGGMAGRRGPQRGHRARHGRRPELPHRGAAPRTAGVASNRLIRAYWRAAGGGSMAGESSFDVVSDFDEQELRNALDQVRREVQQRYDFKGVTVELTQGKTELTLLTDDEHRAAAVRDLIESKAIRRNLSLKIFDWGKVEPAGGSKVRQEIGLRRGLPDDLAKRLTKLIRDEFPKVKSQIQGDAVRVSGKSKDDLQKVIARLRELDEPVPLQFQNYR